MESHPPPISIALIPLRCPSLTSVSTKNSFDRSKSIFVGTRDGYRFEIRSCIPVNESSSFQNAKRIWLQYVQYEGRTTAAFPSGEKREPFEKNPLNQTPSLN